MNRTGTQSVRATSGFPRMIGDEPSYQWARLNLTEFSPHEWG